MSPKLLILDLDETLIYATETALEVDADFRVGSYFVYTRPYLNEFFVFAIENFTVAIWTTSSETYARAILENILPDGYQPLFVWTRDRCTVSYDEESQTPIYVKKLAKLRGGIFKRDQILVVDDTPKVWGSSYGNLVRVSRFEGDISDNELELLIEYLERLRRAADVRRIEKRNWRREITKARS